jgi:eukaryotic-like serine/threonine-protein kinase
MGRNDDGWHLDEGELLAPGLSALRRLGGGAAYEAWLCFDEVTWSPVVVKALRPSQLEDESSRRGLRREVLALATVNHPVVVRGLRDGQDGDRPHVVLEHIDGPRLSSLVRRHGRLQEQQYLPLAIDVAAALHYFRHIGWTHLDIKPSNVIMGAPARLIDLSVARPATRAAELTYFIGSDFYMSPEQCAPQRVGRPGVESDVWGLGATLFEAVAGYRPFDDGDPHSDDPTVRFPQLLEPPYELPDRVPGEVAKVVYGALEADPADRPLPHEIATALEPVLARQPVGKLTFKVRG